MFRIKNLWLLFVLLPFAVRTQTDITSDKEIQISDFRGTLSFLASGWMEGREAGERGCSMAADYIASLMETCRLEPFGDSLIHENRDASRSYFQKFVLVRYTTAEATLSVVDSEDLDKTVEYSFKTNFTIEPGIRDISEDFPLVFAGYGISLPIQGYDDYENLDVWNRVVIVLPGFPGDRDTNSVAWQKIGKILEQSDDPEYEKRKVAKEKGAAAIIEIFDPYFNETTSEPVYEDYLLLRPADTSLAGIPVIYMKSDAILQLLAGSGIHVQETEALAGGSLKSSSTLLDNKHCKFSIKVKKELIGVRNVLGAIYGKDTTRQIIIGAHYDHLGKRDTLIYYGADDNASGTAGMLALAKHWNDNSEPPPCNLVFAAWTAEEEGMLGSSYFVDHCRADKNNLPLYVNLDMISRSDPTDSLRNILSVGTLKGSERLKDLIRNENSMTEKPFSLDLWQCDKDGDSDYAPFAKNGIPVMTFFSGFHDDYHTPRDVVERVDFEKMCRIVNLVNDCIGGYFAETGSNGKE